MSRSERTLKLAFESIAPSALTLVDYESHQHPPFLLLLFFTQKLCNQKLYFVCFVLFFVIFYFTDWPHITL